MANHKIERISEDCINLSPYIIKLLKRYDEYYSSSSISTKLLLDAITLSAEMLDFNNISSLEFRLKRKQFNDKLLVINVWEEL